MQRGNIEDIVDAIQRYIEGHIKESVDCRNFRRRTQQPRGSFNDLLVALRELAKMCKHSYVIKLWKVGDTMEDLLKEKDLTLETTITKCRG